MIWRTSISWRSHELAPRLAAISTLNGFPIGFHFGRAGAVLLRVPALMAGI
jgi:hypothetical protein